MLQLRKEWGYVRVLQLTPFLLEMRGLRPSNNAKCNAYGAIPLPGNEAFTMPPSHAIVSPTI